MRGARGGVARRRVAGATAGAAVLLAALDAYVVVTIMVTIIRDLEIPIDHLERATPIITGYLLGYVAAMPLLGQLSDRIGRMPVLQGCLMSFAAGSALSAVAPSLPILVAGRLLQGAAGGALLPVTLAIIGDQWEARARPLPLGAVGATQELGSVLGPLYGAVLAGVIGWRGLFWINVPLAAVAAVAIRRSIPDIGHRGEKSMDLVGGAILALSLSALIVALYNPDPAAGVLPVWGPWTLVAGGLGLVAFALWERRSPVRLLDPGSVRSVPFAAALGTSFLSGVALMVTLVDVPLLAQTLLGKDSFGAALILSRFLIALSVGAAVGGLAARRLGERPVAATGLLIAAAGYLLIAAWPLDILEARHVVGPLALRRLDVDLAAGGLGLGLIIAPIASVALRSSAPDRHGVAASGVVVTRMMGMLIGIAALAAWGLHRFQELTADLVPPLPVGLSPEAFARQLAAYESAVIKALRTEYREIFLITAGICLVGALIALALGRRAPQPCAANNEPGCGRLGKEG